MVTPAPMEFVAGRPPELQTWSRSPSGTRDQVWMLFDQRSTAAADGRGLNEGEIYGADGRLFASCAQESMLRSNR